MAKKPVQKADATYPRLAKAVAKGVAAAKLAPAIDRCERELAKLPKSSFHCALEQSWLDQTDEAAGWLAAFHEHTAKLMPLKAIYVELTRFEINTKVWDAHAFAYDFFGDPDDLGWLVGWKHSTNRPLILKGMAEVQSAYRRHVRTSEPRATEQHAAETASVLLELRFQDLMLAAARQARKKRALPEDLPVLAATHDSDLIARSYGRVKPHVTRVGPERPKASVVPADGMRHVYQLSGGWDEFRNSLPWDILEGVSIDAEMQLSELLDQTRSLAEDWKPPRVKLRSRKWRCDLLSFGAGHHWAVNQRARQALEPLFADSVEFLPVRCPQVKPCWVLHPLRYVDLAPTARHNAKGISNITVIERYDFVLAAIEGLHLFGVHQAPRSDARKGGFCFLNDYVSDAFKAAIESHGLQGVVFERVFAYRAEDKRMRRRHGQ